MESVTRPAITSIAVRNIQSKIVVGMIRSNRPGRGMFHGSSTRLGIPRPLCFRARP